MKQFLNFILFVGFLAALFSIIGCDNGDNEYRNYREHPVDQLFRDHNGIRVYYVDERGVYVEKRYGEGFYRARTLANVPLEIQENFQPISRSDVERGWTIFKDLEVGERGYAHVIFYEYMVPGDSNRYTTYVEIHLPEDQGISPGNEQFGTLKHRKFQPMSEIK